MEQEMTASLKELRPDSQAFSLFNPAFCAVLLNSACKGYDQMAKASLPISLAFLILPNAMHKPTRDSLPATVASSMWNWIKNHPDILYDLPPRVRELRPYTAKGMEFGIRTGLLRSSSGHISCGKLQKGVSVENPTKDWEDCLAASFFLGKWFGKWGPDQSTILSRWGMQP